jgi:3-oxoadipate CoA-transferase alpha subunit
MPFDLIDALIRQGAKDLTIVSNNAGNGDVGLAALLKAGQVKKVLCSFPRQAGVDGGWGGRFTWVW